MSENINIDILDFKISFSDLEIKELFQKIRQGNELARKRLISYGIRYVTGELLYRFKEVPYEKKELMSIGCIGLIKAVDTFDISRNIKFSTYAYKCIDNEILMFLRKMKVYNNRFVSLDKTISSSNNKKTLLDFLVDDTCVPDNLYLENEIKQVLFAFIQSLSSRDKEIMILYFYKQISQGEIAEKFNLSQSFVSKRIKKILKYLKVELEEYMYGKNNLK